MIDFLELAERCERATKSDRELDALVWAVVVAPAGAYVEQSRFNGEWCIYLGVDRKGEAAIWEYRKREHRPQPVTSSIDAALALLPDHMSSELTRSAASEFTRCRLWDWRRSPTMSDPGNEWKAEGNRPLPLNICAAALRARHSLAVVGDVGR